MRVLLRWTGRLVLLVVVLVLGLLSPVAYVETMCRPAGVAVAHTPLVGPDWQRPEGRTLLTYPEWHIVHAYADYGEVIRTADPHDYGFLSAIAGFWSSTCALSQASGPHGGFPWETKQMVYTIGVSFTAELLAKAAYEETIGRIFTLIRGDTRAPLDDLSARQAADYAVFLQQTPWYKWDFPRDAAELDTQATDSLRDRERRFALGAEYWAKAAYAQVIAAAVAAVGEDQLRLRAVVSDLPETTLAALPDVQVIETLPEGIVIEAPRYRAFTKLAATIAAAGGRFTEIAGNDDILFTIITDQLTADAAIHSFPRQGNPGFRHLVLVPVSDLAATLNALPQGALEHIHDY
ncbi:hypothetical protein EI545_09695 [Tabrizicola piscis]|uniref:Uncharacterized protein n=1 Tax=Tabrizicola piscis TaxID=2494374 RepID=A0A3S8U681_9RHOB|nr:hypothetical protein [Tabrizicola piscis]AZL59088.1 hypothetical protein EI545_09695 [Tabrizicola piscis]